MIIYIDLSMFKKNVSSWTAALPGRIRRGTQPGCWALTSKGCCGWWRRKRDLDKAPAVEQIVAEPNTSKRTSDDRILHLGDTIQQTPRANGLCLKFRRKKQTSKSDAEFYPWPLPWLTGRETLNRQQSLLVAVHCFAGEWQNWLLH